MKTGFCFLLLLLVSNSSYSQYFYNDYRLNRPIVRPYGVINIPTYNTKSGNINVLENGGSINYNYNYFIGIENTGNLPENFDKTLINERLKNLKIDTNQLEQIYKKLITTADTNGFCKLKIQYRSLALQRIDQDFASSIELLTRVLSITKKHNLMHDEAWINAQLSMYYGYKQMQTASEKHKNICLGLIEKIGNNVTEVIGDAYMNLGRVNYFLPPNSTLVNYDSIAIVIFENTVLPIDKRIADCYFNMSSRYIGDKQMQLLNEAKKRYEFHPDCSKDLFYRKTLNNLASNYIDKSNFKNAFDLLQKTIEYNLNTKDTSALSYNYYNLSRIYSGWNMNDSALATIDRSLQFQSRLNKTNLFQYSIDLKANLFLKAGDYATAYALFNQELAFVRSQPPSDYTTLFNLYHLLGNCNSALKNYSNAIQCYKLALPISLNANDSIKTHNSYAQIAYNYLLQESYLLSNQILDSCLKYTNNPIDLFYDYWHKASSLQYLNKNKSALYSFDKAQDNLNISNNISEDATVSFYSQLGDIYRINAKYDSANIYYEKSVSLDKKNIQGGNLIHFETNINSLLTSSILTETYIYWLIIDKINIQMNSTNDSASVGFKFDTSLYEMDKALSCYRNNFKDDFISSDGFVLSQGSNAINNSLLKSYIARLAVLAKYNNDSCTLKRLKSYCGDIFFSDLYFLIQSMEAIKNRGRINKEIVLSNIEKAQKTGFNDFAFIERNKLFAPIRKDKRYIQVINLMKDKLEED